MRRLWDWCLLSWMSLTRREQVHAVLLTIFAAGVIGHQLAYVYWFIEDSAISFAFARNLVRGEGLVAYVGGERVEGYSNPTWVAVLAFFQLFRLDPFQTVKVIQVFLGLGVLPPVYLAAREAMGKESDAPLLATGFLAANAQFAIWGAAGLENGLLHLLMALGIWRMMVELRTGGAPWSSLAWMLVALTRPEGILYSAVAGFWAMIISIHARRSLLPTLQWLALFFVPWTAYQAWHLWYFAWPFPNTYYAKLGDRDFVHWLWNDKAWKWSRNFYHELAQGYFLPLWLLGVLGDGPRRYWLVGGLFVALATWIQLCSNQRYLLVALVGSLWFLFWLGLRWSEGDKPQRALMIGATIGGLSLIGLSELVRYAYEYTPAPVTVPELATTALPYALAAFALLLPIAGFGVRGWQLRGLAWLMCCAATMFAIYVQWDWMKGFRWYSPAVVPGSLLFAFGADGLILLLERMFARVEQAAPSFRRYTPGGVAVAVGLIVLQAVPNVWHTVAVAMKTDTSPRGVLPRVKHVQRIRDRLHIDERVVDLDIDQGAHLWWSDFEMMDMAGLIDIPFAHQHYEKAFLQEYIFEEMRPHYAHVHGQWANTSKIPTVSAWRKQYVEVPGYPAGENEHIGSFVRRDLIVVPSWPYGAERSVAMDGEIELYGPVVPSEPAVGRKVYVEVGVLAKKVRKLPKDNFRMVLFAAKAGKLVASWDLPPGYDWLYPKAWTAEEVFVGKFDLPLPKDLAAGTYDLGIALFDADGLPIGALAGAGRAVGSGARIGGEEGTPALFVAGEVQYPGALVVLAEEMRDAASQVDHQDALVAAAAGKCAEAERSWWLARKHRPLDTEWSNGLRDEVERAFADCWAKSADGLERPEQITRLVQAREWDHWSDEYRSRAIPLADELYAEGLAARAAQDWETAYRAFADAVNIDRSRSWARRYAEEARAWRLGIDEASLAKRDAEEKERKKSQQEKAKAAREKAEKLKLDLPKEPATEPADDDPPGGE